MNSLLTQQAQLQLLEEEIRNLKNQTENDNSKIGNLELMYNESRVAHEAMVCRPFLIGLNIKLFVLN